MYRIKVAFAIPLILDVGAQRTRYKTVQVIIEQVDRNHDGRCDSDESWQGSSQGV